MLVLAGHLEQFGLSPKANRKAVTYFKLWKQYGHIRIEHISMMDTLESGGQMVMNRCRTMSVEAIALVQVRAGESLDQEIESKVHRNLSWNFKQNISAFNGGFDQLTVVASLNTPLNDCLIISPKEKKKSLVKTHDFLNFLYFSIYSVQYKENNSHIFPFQTVANVGQSRLGCSVVSASICGSSWAQTASGAGLRYHPGGILRCKLQLQQLSRESPFHGNARSSREIAHTSET